ncbi:2'-5' RNA ligase family protein [Fodinibius salsisoli]|uniref:2'-5' RNA ligase family protein n=1 Tax=Fodinibius salsisoli TaxID=2820877 RepID=A0ABT3PND3_9BACT|nr:2'-5' RNA ligase family protein [Fodinibius salsisoli]MCW9706854.1 2'-5' RNA ligase family protein [Fodinibius salsisoli]
MSASSVYSLWLQPNGDIAYQLQERIKKLSKKYKTPAFAPHVTLLGSLSASETELISLTNTLASSLHPTELFLTKAGYQNQFYQSLFVHVKKDTSLKEMRGMACRLFDKPDTEPYKPHLSLLYGDLSQKEKERILNITGREFHIRFSVNSIVLMQTEGQPEQWKKIHTAVFKLK